MGRRGPGEGTIRKRPNGLWEARIDLGIWEGKRRVKTVYGKTRREVQQKLDGLKRQVADGVNLFETPQTVEDYLRHWLDYTAINLLPSTQKQYRSQQLVVAVCRSVLRQRCDNE